MPHYRDIELTEEQRRALVQKKTCCANGWCTDVWQSGHANRSSATGTPPEVGPSLHPTLAWCSVYDQQHPGVNHAADVFVDTIGRSYGMGKHQEATGLESMVPLTIATAQLKGFGVDHTVAGYSVPEWHRDRWVVDFLLIL